MNLPCHYPHSTPYCHLDRPGSLPDKAQLVQVEIHSSSQTDTWLVSIPHPTAQASRKYLDIWKDSLAQEIWANKTKEMRLFSKARKHARMSFLQRDLNLHLIAPMSNFEKLTVQDQQGNLSAFLRTRFFCVCVFNRTHIIQTPFYYQAARKLERNN